MPHPSWFCSGGVFLLAATIQRVLSSGGHGCCGRRISVSSVVGRWSSATKINGEEKPGFYKRGCQERTLFPFPSEEADLDIQPRPPLSRKVFELLGRQDFWVDPVHCTAEFGSRLIASKQKPVVQTGQPWFYLRLAHGRAALQLCWVIRGGIQCPVRLVPIPARILTLEPERSAAERTGSPGNRAMRRRRSSCLRLQMLNVELRSFLPERERNRSDLAR